MKIWKLAVFVSILCLAGCAFHPRQAPPMTTTMHVNLHRYAGTWYEIASFPTIYQRGCVCTKAQYQLRADMMMIANSCHRDYPSGWYTTAHAKAWPVVGSHNSRFKVQFFWPFKGDYWILYLDKQYRYAIVGGPSYRHLWILARKRHISATMYQHLVNIAAGKGFQVAKLNRTLQTGCHS